MKIEDLNGNRVKACMSFDYRGYIISCSTMFNAYNIIVYPITDDQSGEIALDTHSVQAAIEWVNQNPLPAN